MHAEQLSGIAGPCANALTIQFSGFQTDPVEDYGPFSFPGWLYDFKDTSNPPYSQAIYNPTTTGAITVNSANGILLCKIAAGNYNFGTLVGTFQGTRGPDRDQDAVASVIPSLCGCYIRQHVATTFR